MRNVTWLPRKRPYVYLIPPLMQIVHQWDSEALSTEICS